MRPLRPYLADARELTRFHSDDYVSALATITPLNLAARIDDARICTCSGNRCVQTNRSVVCVFVDVDTVGLGDSCPVFDGMMELMQLTASGSIACADALNRKLATIAINWSGGMHHARKSEASGLCHVNDSVLAVLELLRYASKLPH